MKQTHGWAKAVRGFHMGWLAIGLLQLFLLQGCNSNGADPLLSADPINTPASSKKNAGDAAGAEPIALPPRLSRDFIQGGVTATITVLDSSGRALDQQSSGASWQQYPPEGPAPQPGAIADFRDYQGCENLAAMDAAQLCFTVSPDVSNVPLTAEKVSLKGIQAWASAGGTSVGCLREAQNLALSGVATSATEAHLSFTASDFAVPDCADPLTVELTLTRI